MKKKLLFVTNHFVYSDGVAKVLLSLLNALDKEKYDITLTVFYSFDKKFAARLDNAVKVKKVFGFYFRGLSRIVRKLPSALWYKLIVKENYDAEIGFQGGIPISLIGKSRNKNAMHIAWMHGYNNEQTEAFEKCDKIAICAKSTAEKFKESFRYPERVFCVYNLVNDFEIQEMAKEKPRIEKKYPFTFCSVGRLSPEKGFLRLLKCHKRLMDEGMYHNLWIVGDGSTGGELRSYVKENKLNESVILTGFDENPYKYMAHCDCFVCSSYTEGYSTVCTESAILGTPIISTLVNGAKELIEDNDCGIVVENDDEALYLGMKKMLLNKELLFECKKNLENPKTPLFYRDRLKAAEEFFENI